MRVIHTDAIVCGDGPSIVDGAVALDDRGAIVDVGPASELLPRHHGAPIERIVGVLLPGLVNAHVHIELSALRGRVVGGGGFVPWVKAMTIARSAEPPEDDAQAIDCAVSELASFGTVAVGEVTNSLAAAGALFRQGFAGSIFHETFGVREDQAKSRYDALESNARDRFPAVRRGDLQYAPAIHALFSTHPSVVRALIESVRARGLRTTIHLAEHSSERRALESGDGPLVEWFESIGIASSEVTWPLESPVYVADKYRLLAPDVLAVHLTDARRDELARIAERQAPVVLCPRSNLFIEMRLPPLLAMREVGIEAALGTDSLASNLSLDVLAEARALFDRFPDVPARELIQMATFNGARALGLDALDALDASGTGGRRGGLGRIARGARPGLFVVEGAVEAESHGDPAAWVLKNVNRPRRVVSSRLGAR